MGATSLLNVAPFFEVLALLIGSRLKQQAPTNAVTTMTISDFFTMITPSDRRSAFSFLFSPGSLGGGVRLAWIWYQQIRPSDHHFVIGRIAPANILLRIG